jgi:ribosome maturation factor RimP
MSTKTALWDITESYLVAEHLELDDLEMLGKGKSRKVRVVVDGQNLDLDRLAEVSRGLSRLYDAESDTEGPYQLEVTSPGLERALKRPSHFVKSTGREVVLKARQEDGHVFSGQGVIADADNASVMVDVDGVRHRYSYEDVISARTVFRWEPTPKPGK